jgi:cyclase
MSVRIIPRLDIKGPNLVKGIHLEGLRVMGKPETFARHYYEAGADELLYMDIVASLYERNNLLEIVEKTSREIFIPLTVGGGLRSIEDIRAVLGKGADKVALNTAAIKRPELITEAAHYFGSSTVVVSIEAKRKNGTAYEAYIDNGREKTGLEVLGWARRAEALGAGEIMITAIDQEGTGKGFDLDLTKQVAEAVSIPVIACGGAGEIPHVHDVVTRGRADGVCVASLFHYHFVKHHDLDDGEGNGNGSRRRLGSSGFSRISEASLKEVKDFLGCRGIDCRTS